MKPFNDQGSIKAQPSQSPPFSTRLLEDAGVGPTKASRPNDEYFHSLLPASYRNASDDLVPPSSDESTDPCVKKELDLQRLSKVFAWLWLAGRPMPPRPLHYQLLAQREIFVTEQMDMHLVWTTDRIFLKPIPRFLLEPHFWNHGLSCQKYCPCSEAKIDAGGNIQYCERQRLRRCALGFLFSYTALISHESDLLIAKEKHLVPLEVEWPSWRIFVQQLDPEHIYPKIDARFTYGELRLSRLNDLYYFSRSPFLFLRGYFLHWNQYRVFLGEHFTWLASATIYIAIVLTAMQVGLATDFLSRNQNFQSVSYGFTVFAILGPLVTAGFIMLLFCTIFVYNCIVTIEYKKKRFRHIKAKSEKP